MKRALFAALLAGLLLISGCGEPHDADTFSAAPASKTPDEPTEPVSLVTEAPTPTCAPLGTAAPAVTTAAPASEPPEIPEGDLELLVLVNFENPIYQEPPVELIAEALTAGNVTCDPRRHANARAIAALDELLNAAAAEGEYHFIIASAFRSIWEQEILWNGRNNHDPSYGSDPYNAPVSVMPKNCSEHTTGLAFDILCDACPHSDPTYASTAEGRWLMQNAWRYGFVLRYPAGKEHVTGVQYEPWHYRYVGRAAAEYMHAHGLCLEELVELMNES